MTEPLLVACGLRMNFGGVVAVQDVDILVESGELVCIIGPNGAGKSTLLNLLSGALKPLAGTIRFAGTEMVGRPMHQYARRGIVRKFQGASTFQWMTARDNLLVAGLGVAANSSGGLPDIGEALQTIGLLPQADTIAEALSHGQRQWLEIGMTLMCQPKLLLLDEPTAGMTVEGSRTMADLIQRLKGRFATIVIEHNMGFVERLDCRTLVMHQGQVICEGRFADLTQDSRVRDVYLGRPLRDASDR